MHRAATRCTTAMTRLLSSSHFQAIASHSAPAKVAIFFFRRCAAANSPVQHILQASKPLQHNMSSSLAGPVSIFERRKCSTAAGSGRSGEVEPEPMLKNPIQNDTEAMYLFEGTTEAQDPNPWNSDAEANPPISPTTEAVSLFSPTTTEPPASSSMQSMPPYQPTPAQLQAKPTVYASKLSSTLSSSNYVLWGNLTALKILMSLPVWKTLERGDMAVDRAGHFVLVFTVRDANGQFKFDKVAVWVHPTLEQFVPIAVMPLQPHKIIVYPHRDGTARHIVNWEPAPQRKLAASDIDVTPGQRVVGHISVTTSSPADNRTITVAVTAAQHIILKELVMSSLPGLCGFDVALRS